jgi:carbamoyl-phosphate synthase small subunit
MPRPALLVLEDGASFAGEALVGSGTVGGELVFTTSMGGYQEIASDPSYHGQIVVYTFPMIGNYGAAAIVAREITNYRFNRAADSTWLAWLSARDVLAVSGVDTRAVTRHIRERGSPRAVVSTETDDIGTLRAAARRVPAMSGRDLAVEVTCAEPREVAPVGPADARFHVVVVDLGVKRSILELLVAQGCRLTVVPAATSARAILKLEPDGVLLSNGPGDPAAVTYAVKTTQRLLGKTPVFGICLGHQMLALALGLRTYKLPFGHRGANHPVKELRTGRVEITTQNHGFAVARPDELPPGVELTHVNLNDGTVEGLANAGLSCFSVQFHPEASPGPHDARHLFARFVAQMGEFRGASERAGTPVTASASRSGSRASSAARRPRRQATSGSAPSAVADEQAAAARTTDAHAGDAVPAPDGATEEAREDDTKGDRARLHPSLKDALRGRLGRLNDLGRRER